MKAYQSIKNLVWQFLPYELGIIPRLSIDRINALMNSGSAVECPCCNKQFAQMLDAGNPVRNNVRCPFCRSLERQRFIWLYLQRETDLFKEDHRLLHIAPERCFYRSFAKSTLLDYTAADKFTKGNKYPRKTVNFDLTEARFSDEYFDVFICCHVLEHIPDDYKAISELYRMTRRNGWGILQVPIRRDMPSTFEDPSIVTEAEREAAYGQFDHVRQYGLDFIDRVTAAGFDVTRISCEDFSSPQEMQRYRIIDSDDIYVCRRN